MNWKFKSYLGLGTVAFVLGAASSAYGQVYTSSDLVAIGEIGMAAGIGGWNDVANDHQEKTDIAGQTLLSTTSYTGPDPDSLGETLSGGTSASVTSVLDPGNYNATFATSAAVTRTSGNNPFTNPAAKSGVSQSVDIITGPAGTWTFNATATILNQESATSAFSFQGSVEDHTAGWTHNFTVAAAANAFTPYSESDVIASGDWVTISWYEEPYGFSNENDGVVLANSSGSVSFTGPTSVPEPGSVVFVLFGAASFAIRKNRRTR